MMNKFKIIATVVCVVLSFIIFVLFDIEPKWYYFLVPIFLGNYIGGVVISTKKGFNITDINFLTDKNQEDVSRIMGLTDDEKPLWFSKYEDMQQWFTVEVVTDFKGTKRALRGCFTNHLKINTNDLRTTLNKKAKQSEIIKLLQEGDIVIEQYHYGTDDYLEVIFTAVLY